jgi:hypothetical protein
VAQFLTPHVNLGYSGTLLPPQSKKLYVFVLVRMHPLILSFKPITKLSCSLNAVFPGLKMWDTFAYATASFLTRFIISSAVLENVPPDAGLQKRATFSTLHIGLAGTGNRTRATYVASIGTNRLAIHYASLLSGFTTVLCCTWQSEPADTPDRWRQ